MDTPTKLDLFMYLWDGLSKEDVNLRQYFVDEKTSQHFDEFLNMYSGHSPLEACEILTTGQVAKILRMAPRTVSRIFDEGSLKGYNIPGSRDRRILASSVRSLMKENGIPENLLNDILLKKRTPKKRKQSKNVSTLRETAT